ncbi:MAG: hypothetical protein JWQ79_18 [Mucilaginibacter sp.]|nr:hypothetical protein [Mucilaginibacter sp.]
MYNYNIFKYNWFDIAHLNLFYNQPNMNRHTKIKTIIWIIIAVFFIACIISAFINLRDEIVNNPSKFESTPPVEYTNLFGQGIKKTISHKTTIVAKLRPPISVFDYDGKYNIEITKINLKPGLSLKKIMNETLGEADFGNGTYIQSQSDNMTVNYKSTSIDTIPKLQLTLYGDSVNIAAKSDTTAYYYLMLKNFSIQNRQNNSTEIFTRIKSGFLSLKSPEIPAEILFLKRQNTLYVLVLTVNDPKIKLEHSLLLKLTGKQC